MSTKDTNVTHKHEGHRARMRKRFMHDYGESMESHELLEMLLFYVIPRRNTNEIAHALLARFGTLTGTLAASVEELMQIDGVGENVAIYLKNISAIIRRNDLDKQIELPKYTSISALMEYVKPLFTQLTHERLYLLCFDSAMRMISCDKVSDGSANAVSVNAQIMLRIALTKNAHAVVLAHNHPNGIACPSAADLTATAQYRDAFDKAGMLLVEHFVVAGEEAVSLINQS